MQKSDFYYDLPPALIAQRPAHPRDASRLMVLDKTSDAIRHFHFHDLPGLLRPGDLLVLNDTKVIPARLIGQKQATGGACELLLLRQTSADTWECLAKPGRSLKPGAQLVFGDGSLTAQVGEDLTDGRKRVAFRWEGGTFYEVLDRFGRMPLPPYIKQQVRDNSEYQTVYARLPGSAAAPTAGLHFTPAVFEALANRGVGTATVTLHVGLGTFRPVQAERIEDHPMHTEWYSVDPAAARAVNETRQAGGRVVAVGTTCCRTLETLAGEDRTIRPGSGETGIFIYPGYRFKAVDGLLTNFHLPESTLIMLVAALYGLDKTMAAYQEAVRQEYRFFSFGDAMLIL